MRVICQLEPPLMFQLLAVILSIECCSHIIPTHLPLQILINIPCQTLLLPSIKFYPSSSIVVSLTGPYHSIALHQRKTPSQVCSMCLTPFWQCPAWTRRFRCLLFIYYNHMCIPSSNAYILYMYIHEYVYIFIL